MSEQRVQGLLHLIRRTHVEHDARIAMSNAIHQAEVVLLGRGDYELAGRISERLVICKGTLVSVIGPATRFAVKAIRATAVEIDHASSQGVAVIDEGEFDRMIEIYAVHTGATRTARPRCARPRSSRSDRSLPTGAWRPRVRSSGARRPPSRHPCRRTSKTSSDTRATSAA
jgi:hypothetical protein